MPFILKSIFLVVSLMVLSINSYAKTVPKKYVIATASSGGTFYPVGVAIATIASLKLSKTDNIIFSAITSAGSCENINRLVKNEINFGILQGLCGSMAWQGKGKHEGKPKKNLRSVSMLWQNVEQFTIKSQYAKTGNIKDLDNLVNKKFSIGGRSSGSRVSAEIILKSLGIEYKNMDLQYFGYSESSRALINNSLIGMNTPAGVPTAAVTTAIKDLGIDEVKILEFTLEDLENINTDYPVWSPYVIKAGTYLGQAQDIQTIAQPNLLVVTKETPEDVVYLLTKTMYENLEFLNSVHKATKSLSLQKAILGLPMPLHKGAIRFYREKGIKIPSRLIESK